MIDLLERGQYQTFVLLLFTIIISLSCHEFGHAMSAKRFGDRTAEQQGRLTLNPIAHIDPIGLLMIVIAGFGWAKPVPTNPRFFNSRWATMVIAAAGPFANLILAFVAINFYAFSIKMGYEWASTPSAREFFVRFSSINILLMLFNLIPLGPLDGHYILPYLLSSKLSIKYQQLNAQYGTYAFMGLILLSFAGLPIFSGLRQAAFWILDLIQIIG